MENLHCRSDFHFSLSLPYDDAFPLFGAWNEQKWDSSWTPHFIYPAPPRDQEGSVFVVESSQHRSVWVTTIFDQAGGHVQYVNVRDNHLVTRIDIRITSASTDVTDVSVAYERTALDEAAASEIDEFARNDLRQGSEWKSLIEAFLQSHSHVVEKHRA
jgi:hypothetical protein